MHKITQRRLTATLATAILLAAAPSFAEEEAEDLGWFDTAELTFVNASGNAEASTLGFKNVLERRMDGASFVLSAGGLRAESTTLNRIAIGASPTSFRIDESKDSNLTAENYFLRGDYNRKLSEKRFWHLGAGWERNEFAGIKNRYTAVAGLGNIFYDSEEAHFSVAYGLTYTQQDDVVENPDASDGFLGARGSWDYMRQLNPSTTYTNVFIVDANLDESEDWRADMVNALAVAMSERLALKVSFQLLYDNLPSLTNIPFIFDDGTPGDLSVVGPLDELDTLLNVALVVTF